MKLKNKIISAAALVAALAILLCTTFAVGAADNAKLDVTFSELKSGVTALNATLADSDKPVDYVQVTLTPNVEGIALVENSVKSDVENLSVQHSVSEDGSVTALLIPTASGVAMENGTNVLSWQITGAQAGDVLEYTVHYILCYTDGTDFENTITDSVEIGGETVISRLEAETDAVLWRYSDTDEGGTSGYSVGGVQMGTNANMQTYEELAGGAWLEKSEHPMMSFIVDVEADGAYTLDITHNGGMTTGSISDYFMVVSVDDAAYTKTSYVGTHPDNASYHVTQAKLSLTAGRHVIRVITALADTRSDTLKINWVNIDGVDVSGAAAVTAVAPQQTHLLSGEASYIHNYKASTEFDSKGYPFWVSSLGSYSGDTATANAGITSENFIIENLPYLGYFSYTVDVPADGYYDMQTYLQTNTSTSGTGYMLMLIDGVKHRIPVVAGYATYAYNAQNLSCYLTEGTHNIVVSGIMEYTASSKNWCNLGALSVSGGITVENVEQIDPMTLIPAHETVYVSASGSDIAAGTQDAPVASLATAMDRVADGGTIVLVDGITADDSFVWPESTKTVTVTGAPMDFSALTAININSAVTFDNMALTIADGAEIYANGNKVKVSENVTVNGVGYIFGGSASGSVESTDLTVLAGTWTGIYGGGATASVTGSTNLVVGGNVNAGIDLTDHSLQHFIYGGSRRGNVGTTNVTVQDNACAITVYGGGSGTASADWCDFGTSNVTINGGNIMSVYGGNCFGPGKSGCQVNITVNGGTMQQVFGGHEWAHSNLTGDVNITLNGGTITRRVYGGSYNNYALLSGWETDRHVVGNITLTITGGVNIDFSYNESDRAIYAHSRYAGSPDPFSDENSTIIFADEAAYNAYYSKLCAQDSTMKAIMGSTSAADNIVYNSEKPAYTVTYVADGETVAEYTVNEGESVAKVPAVPEKIGYTGAWDNDGTNITADTTITAVYTPNASVDQWNVALGDDIGVNFYMSIADQANTTVSITVNGETTTVKASELTAENGQYVISVDMAAAQMTDTITVELTCGELTVKNDYSVRAYADYILDEANGYDDVTKALVKEMLNYGAAAQNYFGYNTENLANAGLSGFGTADVSAAEIPAMSVSGSADGIGYYGATLVFGSKTAVRFYFTGDVSDCVFKSGDTQLTAVEKNGMWYVEVGQINPQALSQAITVSVNDALTVTYSPLNYMARMYANSTNANLQALMQAMYNYHLAAAEYAK